MQNLQTLLELDRQHVVHPHLPLAVKDHTTFVRGKDCTLWDAAGRQDLDATGGLWLAQVGHGRDKIADAAAAQIRRLEYFTSTSGEGVHSACNGRLRTHLALPRTI
ncbi:hypothetical protein [Streptomyces sp. NPDC046862]|uniref:hypothetical protein n=1 Tax=Streptomyces sp. NPDC046862 TaxID=3154603 RepID=UPI003453D2EA